MGATLAHVLPAAPPGFWALLAMAATMGGTMRSPLTFAAEIAGNIHVVLPLLAAGLSAHLLTVLLVRRSILTEDARLVGYIGWKDLMKVRVRPQTKEQERVVPYRLR
jgi:H+/Cl- antiporter ClcA